MSDEILLDNDVVLKACAYQFHHELLKITTLKAVPPAILGITRFTLRSRLSKPYGIKNRKNAFDAFEQFLAHITLLSPTKEEIELAAELEEAANKLAVEFDTGESQLVAILILREASLFITGDKRAIRALSRIALNRANGRVACLEQLVALMLTKHSHDYVRRRVCAEPAADKTMTNCFSCFSPSTSPEDINAGLASYIRDLRSLTGKMLVEDADLLAKIS